VPLKSRPQSTCCATLFRPFSLAQRLHTGVLDQTDQIGAVAMSGGGADHLAIERLPLQDFARLRDDAASIGYRSTSTLTLSKVVVPASITPKPTRPL